MTHEHRTPPEFPKLTRHECNLALTNLAVNVHGSAQLAPVLTASANMLSRLIEEHFNGDD